MADIDLELEPVDNDYSGTLWGPWLDLWNTTGQGLEWLPWNGLRMRHQAAEAEAIQRRAMTQIVNYRRGLGRLTYVIGGLVRAISRVQRRIAPRRPELSHIDLQGNERSNWWITGEPNPIYTRWIEITIGPRTAPIEGTIVSSDQGPRQ